MSDPSSASSGGSPKRGGPPARRVRRRRLRRALIAIGAVIVVAAVAAVVGGALLVRRYDSAVPRGNLLAPSARADGSHGLSGPLNLLMIGSDYRTWSPDSGQRSDTIIIAHIPKSMDRAYLISVPRDLLVDIPPDPAKGFSGDHTKINAAFEYGHGGVGGAQLVSATLTQLTGVQFDGAAVIDFSGLQHAVDVIGGVEMCLDTQVVSIHTKRVFQPGCHLMTSAEVLDYLRQRDFPDGDYGRQRHQQQFLKAFLGRALSAGAATNPVKMDELVRAVAGTMTVDTGEISLPDLVFTLRNLRPEALVGVKIPSEPLMLNEVSYVAANSDAAGLFQAIRTDQMDVWVSANGEWVNKI